jgi:hypothetical protein
MNMRALFFITVHDAHARRWRCFLVSTPDGPHDRHGAVLAAFEREHEPLSGRKIHAEFICLTPEDVWKEV